MFKFKGLSEDREYYLLDILTSDDVEINLSISTTISSRLVKSKHKICDSLHTWESQLASVLVFFNNITTITFVICRALYVRTVY